jgi:UDP-2,3-diacylglucosamine pyrophosphatase LpxH
MSILTAPRFSFEPPRAESGGARRVRTAWVSDVHLGTRGANAGALLDFLREYEFETLYIVGDFIDIWQLRRGIYWPQQHNDVIQKILRKSRKGTRIVYIPGNHDDLLAKFYGAYGHITVQKHAIHRLAYGQRMLIIHGHELDTVVQNVKWLAFAGDVGYQFLLSLNPFINFVRRRFGLGYWSLSANAKKRVKDAVSLYRQVRRRDRALCEEIFCRCCPLRPHPQRDDPAIRRGHLLQLWRLGGKLFRADRTRRWRARNGKL